MTGQPLEIIQRDTERDNFMTAEAGSEYGLIDKVIKRRRVILIQNVKPMEGRRVMSKE